MAIIMYLINVEFRYNLSNMPTQTGNKSVIITSNDLFTHGNNLEKAIYSKLEILGYKSYREAFNLNFTTQLIEL